jgi:hypothetical protein
MRSHCLTWTATLGWRGGDPSNTAPVSLILAFCSGRALRERDALYSLEAAYPDALIARVSTAGEISGHTVIRGR